MSAPLWTPSSERVAAATLTRFIAFTSQRGAPASGGYSSLYDWSTSRPHDFWDAMWDFAGVRGDKGPRVAVDVDRMPGARFFPDATLNFAANLLQHDGDSPAIVAKSEAGPARTLSWREL